MEIVKKCSCCLKVKKLDENFRFMYHENRYNAYCKDCERDYQRRYKRAMRNSKKEREF